MRSRVIKRRKKGERKMRKGKEEGEKEGKTEQRTWGRARIEEKRKRIEGRKRVKHGKHGSVEDQAI